MKARMHAWLILAGVSVFGPSFLYADETPVDLRDYLSCGANSLYMVAHLHGVSTDTEKVAELLGPPDSDGTHGFDDLSRAAKALGMHPVAVSADRRQIQTLPMPVIAQVQYSYGEAKPHFLILMASTPDGVYVLDAPRRVQFDLWLSFEQTWSGRLLVFSKDEAERAQLESRLAREKRKRLLLLYTSVIALVVVLGLMAHVCLQKRAQLATAMRRLRPLLTWVISRETSPSWATRVLLITVVITTAGFLTLAVLVLTGWHWLRDPPRLVVDLPDTDLGLIEPGKHHFRIPIRNAGSESVHIESIVTNCSCATVTRQPSSVGPSQADTVDLSLDVTPGPRAVHIAVVTDRKSLPASIRVTCRAIAP